MTRERRKKDHLEICNRFELSNADFSDINLIHNCLSQISWDEISLDTNLVGHKIGSPVFLNAITGGVEEAYEINSALAEIAAEFDIAMAVGSQKIAIESKLARKSFEIVRKNHKDGFIIANIGVDESLAVAKQAIDMLEANAIQLHLNIAQELHMGEGDRYFKGRIENINYLADNLSIPVIIKETGFGIAWEEATILQSSNIKAIDIGGRGGTNFIDIESTRTKIESSLRGWGISTPISLLEVLEATINNNIVVMASGGINTPLDIIKSLALGAKFIGLAGMPLRVLKDNGKIALFQTLKKLESEMKTLMAFLGITQVDELANVPLVILGGTAQWLQQRGFDTKKYAQRKM